MTPAQRWHDDVFERDGYACAAETHNTHCKRRAECAHHLVYRSHLIEEALWLIDNGIALSHYCHLLAHALHNGNIADWMLIRAVDAVEAVNIEYNKRTGKTMHTPYFRKKLA